MNLTNLSSFTRFDSNRFLEGKTLVIKSVKYDSKERIVKGELVILADNCPDDGRNEYGRINYKLTDKSEADVSKYVLKEQVHFVGISKAVIWGDLRDNLTITANDLIKDTDHGTFKKTAG